MIDWAYAVLDLPADRADDATRFWCAALGWALGRPWTGHPELADFVPPTGEEHLLRQVVEAAPRVHLDLEVDDVEAEAARLVTLGASWVRRTADWLTLSSPGGLPHCLVTRRDHAGRPGPVGATGRRHRLVQVCIDAPADLGDREVTYWRAATGWRWSPSPAPEFAGTLYPAPGSPVQLLLQRLAPHDPASSVRAHLDLGCDDREATTRELVDLGATRLWDGRGWTTLRDPAGLLFCATGNSPDAP